MILLGLGEGGQGSRPVPGETFPPEECHARLWRRKTRIVHILMPVVWSAALGVEAAARIFGRARFLNLDKTREIAAGSWTCSPEKAYREIGFRPAALLSERLRQTAAWYRRFGWL